MLFIIAMLSFYAIMKNEYVKYREAIYYMNDIINKILTAGIVASITKAAAVIAATAIVLGVGSKLIDKYFKRSLRRRMNANKIKTIEKIIKNVFSTVVLFVGTAIFLEYVLGVDTSSILTVAGVSGLAVGFASQAIIKDFLSGILLLMEDTITIGDVIETNGYKGVVEDISLRSICIRDEEKDVLHIIPNNMIKNFTNHSRKKGERYCEDKGPSI